MLNKPNLKGISLHILAISALTLNMSGAAYAAGTTLESRDTAGDIASGTSFTGGTVDSLVISADGRYVVFASGATNLVPNDTNGWNDIFLRDRQLGTTVRINLGPGGVEANGDSEHAQISRDGRYITYDSAATNLVSTASNGVYHIFRYDTVTGTTIHVSKTTGGVQGNGSSQYPFISDDGRYISFTSLATNLVTGDTNARPDVFRRDVVSNVTIRVSVTNAGAQGNNTQTRNINMTSSISGNGRYVLFRSSATNLVAGDTNGVDDLFVRDCVGLTTKRVSLSNTGAQANDYSYMGKISDDARYVVWSSAASNLVAGDTNVSEDIFIRDRSLNTTTRLNITDTGTQTPAGSLGSNKPSISDDDRYVTFSSLDPLIGVDNNGVTDTYMRDRSTNTTTRVSIGNLGEQCDDYCNDGVISGNGLYTAFRSDSSNLVVNGYNGLVQLFVHAQ